MSTQRMQEAVREVVSLLVQGDYTAIERLSRGRRLTAAELNRSVQRYGRMLVMPPEDAFQHIDVVDVEAPGPNRHGVRFDLWTAQEGRSDLTLELTLTENEAGSYDLQIDDLHVL